MNHGKIEITPLMPDLLRLADDGLFNIHRSKNDFCFIVTEASEINNLKSAVRLGWGLKTWKRVVAMASYPRPQEAVRIPRVEVRKGRPIEK
jgi:hypothetical protein